jgi:hypothetical protein
MVDHRESESRGAMGAKSSPGNAPPAPPRGPVSFKELAAGVLLLLVGLTCAGFLVVNLTDQLPFWIGQRRQAEVTDLRYELEGEDSQGQQVFHYFVEYQFTLPNGQTISRTENVTAQEWGRVGIGGQIDVLYSPFHPDRVRLDYRRMMPISIFCSVPFAIVGGFCLVFGWRLLRTGLGRADG